MEQGAKRFPKWNYIVSFSLVGVMVQWNVLVVGMIVQWNVLVE